MDTKLTYPNYPDEGLWAVRMLADDGWLTMHNAKLPLLFRYKHRAVRHARFIKGSRVVPIELRELS